MTELAVRADPGRAYSAQGAWQRGSPRETIGSYCRGITLNVPRVGLVYPSVVVRVPIDQLVRNSVLGAMLGGAIPRTQGLHVDQHRHVLLTLARSFGEVQTAEDEVVDAPSEQLADVLAKFRGRAGLPAAEIARMVGIQRRHLYNLADGGSTTREREQRIRSLARIVDDLFERYDDVEMVRSALLAPIGSDLSSFVDLATEGMPIGDAGAVLKAYLDRRPGAPRRYLQTPRRAREQEKSAAKAIEDTLDISPDQRR